MKQLIFAAAIVLATAISADAQPIIRGKAIRQEQRIHQGRRNGELTRAEAYRLQRQQALVRRDIRMARADGRISPRERAMINRRQAVASRAIFQQKHDLQGRR